MSLLVKSDENESPSIDIDVTRHILLPTREIEDYQLTKYDMATYHMHKDSSGYYYWIIKSDKNSKTIAKSSESYNSKQGAKESVDWMKTNAGSAGYRDDTL